MTGIRQNKRVRGYHRAITKQIADWDIVRFYTGLLHVLKKTWIYMFLIPCPLAILLTGND